MLQYLSPEVMNALERRGGALWKRNCHICLDVMDTCPLGHHCPSANKRTKGPSHRNNTKRRSGHGPGEADHTGGGGVKGDDNSNGIKTVEDLIIGHEGVLRRQLHHVDSIPLEGLSSQAIQEKEEEKEEEHHPNDAERDSMPQQQEDEHDPNDDERVLRRQLHHVRLSKSSGVSSSLLTDKSYVSMVYPIAAAGAAGGGAGGAGDDNKRNRALQRRRLSHHSVATSLRSEEDGGTAAGAPTMGDADAALYKDYTYWIKIVFTLGVAQLFVEAGIRVSFMLEAAVHGDMAYYSRAILLADPSQTIWHNAFEFKAALGRVVAKFFGVYFALFGMAGIIIIAISSTTIFTVSGVTLNNRKEIYFWFLALFPLSGVFIFHMVPPCPRSDIIPGSPPPNVSIRKNLIFGFTHRVFLILLPLIVANGMVEAYFYGEFTLFLVTPYLGQRALPFIMGTLFIVQGLASWMWGMAVYKSIVRPRTDPIVPDKWIKNKDPTSGQFVMLFALVILFAIGRASYDTQLLAILNHHYQLTE
ncbi:hypothetical protein FOL47_004562 [Perkinsus chesapeaki]|uniref:Uncharacterized protein n=1 Tax=Perkinsus chesapeaki TaxID=330153 RepID=A0A7J6MZ03_PERCH|nr:hypothetical protein FOL47_004562 [Perkinsus chesapeaki]